MTSAFTWAFGFLAGTTTGFWLGVRWRRFPYSSAAIAFRATSEDAAKVRSKIVSPLAWEDPPEQFIRMDEGRVQRGNGSGGPTTPKPEIVNPLTRKDPPEAMTVEDWVFRSSTRMLSDQTKPQPPYGRVFDGYGRCIGYIPHPKDDTSNSPQTDQ